MKFTLITCFVLTIGASFAEKTPPNIIYLMSDDQNVLSVGAYGNPEVQTPNMDRLANDGVIFDRHYNTTAICMASRANVFTGMYEYKTGTNFSHGNMKADVWEKTYPVLLRKAGYLTAFAGKFGLEVEGRGPKGKAGLCADDFDMWAGGPGQTSYVTAQNPALKKHAKEFPHSTLAYGAFAKDVIRESVKQKKQFCLSISFKAPHRPTTPDPRFYDIYAGKTFTKPANFGLENGEHLSLQSKQGRQHPRFSEWNYDTDYDRVMATYYQQIYAIDVSLGMIREELKAQGIADNTVIIYTSDNGFICGSHGYGSKVLPMEESSRAPLMILDPRSPSAGKKLRSPALTGNIDFAPTILTLAGIPVPANMDGVSLTPLLEDPETDVREQLAFMNLFDNIPTHSLTVLTKQHKYTYWWYGDDNMKPTEELFDLARDPLEMKNLANVDESAPELYTMRRKYDAEVQKWKNQVVDYNGYLEYGSLFDRNIPLDQKKFKPITAKKKKVK
ncbi:sulfatase [Verrucomicrobiaceae bacterium 227]